MLLQCTSHLIKLVALHYAISNVTCRNGMWTAYRDALALQSCYLLLTHISVLAAGKGGMQSPNPSLLLSHAFAAGQ